MPNSSPFVLLIEDDLVDIELIQRKIKKRNLNYEVKSVLDGNEALKLLRGEVLTLDQQENLVILLDINMPVMNGHQFLQELRNDPKLSRTIVFVLSTSDHSRDRALAYDKNVAGYFVKSNIDGFLDTVSAYTNTVEFPPIGTHS